MTVLMNEMTWAEYQERISDKRTPVLFPLGALEQHGFHMPMNVDQVLPGAIAERVARRVGGIVLPPLPFGYKSQTRSGGGNHFPGTTSLDGNTLALVIRDVICELGRHGVRNVVAFQGHYENAMFTVEGIDLALRGLRAEGIRDMRVLHVAYFEFTSQATLDFAWPEGFPGWALEHAALMETSVMLYLRPEWVHMDRIANEPPADFPPYDVYPISAENVPQVPPSGALSSPARATREIGQRFVDEWVDGIAAALVREFGLESRRAAV